MDNPVLALLSTRRSVKPDKLAAPGPSPTELETILTIAARVPDHKKLTPWRFIVFEGDVRERFGEIIAQACRAEEKEAVSEVRLAVERARLTRAPLVVAAISRVVECRGTPEWEQVLSVGGACLNLCLGTPWATVRPGPPSGSPIVRVCAALALAENEHVAVSST